MEVVVEQRVHKQLQAQLEVGLPVENAPAPLHGLLIIIVMISITTWTAAMMAETVVDVMFKHHTVQYADALIQMEAGVEQLAHNQQQVQQPKVRQQHQLQPSQLCQQLMTQVIQTLFSELRKNDKTNWTDLFQSFLLTKRFSELAYDVNLIVDFYCVKFQNLN